MKGNIEIFKLKKMDNILFIFKYITCLFSMYFMAISCYENEALIINDEEYMTNIVINVGCDKTDTQEEIEKKNQITRATDLSVSIKDLTIYIFDSNGNTIGYAYKNYSTTTNTSSLSIRTRKATGCTIYAIANGTDKISLANRNKITSKQDFDKLYYNYPSLADIKSETDHIYFGKMTNVNTNSTSSMNISLMRLYSTFTFNIKIETDNIDGKEIALDSYQLKHLPLGTFISGTKESMTYKDDNKVTLTENNRSGKTVSFTTSVLSNLLPKGTNNNTNGWGDRSNTYAPTNATYLEIACSSPNWQSTYYYYLGGKTLTSTYNSSYDYTDYSIYPNYNYTENITIKGNGTSETGSRVSTTLTNVSASDLGRIICHDGTIYDTVAEAEAAGKTALAMIGYVGPNTGNSKYNRGIAFALENANTGDILETSVDYGDAIEIAKTYKSDALKFSSGWHIPTVQEWNLMFAAFGGHEYGTGVPDASINDILNTWDSGRTREAMINAGGNPFHGGSNFAQLTTWHDKEGFWVYVFDSAYWAWRDYSNTYKRAVRLCFAF